MVLKKAAEYISYLEEKGEELEKENAALSSQASAFEILLAPQK
jgi:hypothetical protein